MKRPKMNMRSTSKYFSGQLSFLLLVTAIMAAPPTSASESKVKVRTEFDRTVNTPNHIIFAARLNFIESVNAEDHDIAVQIVRNRMHLYAEGADEAFLSKMLVTAAALKVEENELTESMLCNPSRDRSKNATYTRLDSLDDARENKWDNAYVKFMSELNEKEEVAFLEWLQKAKEGYYYRTAEHKSLYEVNGMDVEVRVEEACVKLQGETR